MPVPEALLWRPRLAAGCTVASRISTTVPQSTVVLHSTFLYDKHRNTCSQGSSPSGPGWQLAVLWVHGTVTMYREVHQYMKVQSCAVSIAIPVPRAPPRQTQAGSWGPRAGALWWGVLC